VLQKFFSRAELRRGLIGVVPFAIAALFAGCQDSITFAGPQVNPELPASEVRSIPAPVLSELRPSMPVIPSTCGAEVMYHLSDGVHDIGTVRVNNDAENIYVTYATPTEHWWISDTRLAVVTDKQDVPHEDDGTPAPWSFPDTGVHEPPITSVTHQIPLSRVGAGAGQTVYVAAMAGVVHPRDESNYDGPWDWMVMWGLSDPAAPSQVINTYVINDCAPSDTVTEEPPTADGMITITFDDGWKTTITNAFPVLDELGLKGNIAVNSEPIDGGWSDYMTLKDLNTLWAHGWHIVSHSVSHPDLTTLSDADLDHELRDSQQWLVDHGFGPTDVFIVPYHSWGPRERTAIAKYYKRVRGHTSDEFEPEKFVDMPFKEPLDLTAFEPQYAPFTTERGRELTLEKIDYVVNHGKFLDLLFHKITNKQVPAFKLLMEQIAAKYRGNIGQW
jgi:peptidoglycan/xylan/chitin deacetylase (PgdA/CDA1 family)